VVNNNNGEEDDIRKKTPTTQERELCDFSRRVGFPSVLIVRVIVVRSMMFVGW
jgi:hypothetical protein